MFNLHFEELNEELQEEKIDEVVSFMYENGEIKKLDEVEKFSLEDALKDEGIRNDALGFIKVHFPIYF
jgi:hypothetical protein